VKEKQKKPILICLNALCVRIVVIFSLVGVAHIIVDGSVLRTAVVFFYLSNEGISIIENATRLGLPVPNKLREVLEQFKDGGDKDGRKY